MKIVLMVGVAIAVLIGVNKFRKRDDADLWREVTTR